MQTQTLWLFIVLASNNPWNIFLLLASSRFSLFTPTSLSLPLFLCHLFFLLPHSSIFPSFSVWFCCFIVFFSVLSFAFLFSVNIGCRLFALMHTLWQYLNTEVDEKFRHFIHILISFHFPIYVRKWLQASSWAENTRFVCTNLNQIIDIDDGKLFKPMITIKRSHLCGYWISIEYNTLHSMAIFEVYINLVKIFLLMPFFVFIIMVLRTS